MEKEAHIVLTENGYTCISKIDKVSGYKTGGYTEDKNRAIKYTLTEARNVASILDGKVIKFK